MAGKFRILIRNTAGLLVQEFSVNSWRASWGSHGHFHLTYEPTHPADPNNGVQGVLEAEQFIPGNWMITILTLTPDAKQIPFGGSVINREGTS